MELHYITQLEKNDFIDLIHFCIEKQNENDQKEGMLGATKINNVTIFDEIGQRDKDGNRYFWLRTFYGSKVLSSYRITDFDMVNMDPFDRQNMESYTPYLREFMAKRFKEEYIKALYQYHLLYAEREMKHLLSCLPKERRM